MHIRLAAADAPAAIEMHEAVGLVYDIQAADFSIPGGSIHARLTDAPVPTRMVLDGTGLMLCFHTSVEARRFSEALREARNTASRLDERMLD